jgi:phage terminase large subunit
MSAALQLDLKTPEVFLPLYAPKRYKVLYGGRGGAKSFAVADALIVKAWEQPLLILCTRELQRSIKESVHKLLSDRIEHNGFGSEYEILNNEIRGKNGSRFIFAGLRHNVAEIKSTEGVDVCWVEEAERVTDESWKTLIPTIRKPSSEIWISFNPRLLTDATYQRFVLNPPPEAWVQKVSWRDNPWFPGVLKMEMEYLKSKDYEEYMHVWEGELKMFADGSIYRKQLEKARKDNRVTSVPIENGVEVHTFWDLGRNDHTAIWFMQNVGREYRFVDYYSARFEDIEHYARVIKDKGYLYGTHWMPHDVEAQMLGMKANRKVLFEQAGVKPIEVVPRVADLMDGIAQVKQIFDSCWFDAQRCDEGIKALANYSRSYDDERDTYSERPVHNWASNGSDAFRMFAQGFKDTSKPNLQIMMAPQYEGGGWMR